MSQLIDPPSIAEQSNELLEFIVNQCIKFDKDCDDYLTVPKCEKGKGPAKFSVYAGVKLNKVPMSRYHTGHDGHVVINARDCPHCGTLEYKNSNIAEVVMCLSCNKKYIW